MTLAYVCLLAVTTSLFGHCTVTGAVYPCSTKIEQGRRTVDITRSHPGCSGAFPCTVTISRKLLTFLVCRFLIDVEANNVGFACVGTCPDGNTNFTNFCHDNTRNPYSSIRGYWTRSLLDKCPEVLTTTTLAPLIQGDHYYKYRPSSVGMGSGITLVFIIALVSAFLICCRRYRKYSNRSGQNRTGQNRPGQNSRDDSASQELTQVDTELTAHVNINNVNARDNSFVSNNVILTDQSERTTLPSLYPPSYWELDDPPSYEDVINKCPTYDETVNQRPSVPTLEHI